jgi:lysophospholipase L1-like esterase
VPNFGRCVLVGDSVTDGNNNTGTDVCWYGSTQGRAKSFPRRIREGRAAAGFVDGLGYASPIYFPKGVAGELIAAMTARIPSYAALRPNMCILQGGTNDATAGRTQIQAQTDTAAAIAAAIASYPLLTFFLVIGPWLVEDKWPNGVNAQDTNLNNVNNGMRAACLAASVPFVDIRTQTFLDLPTLNPGNTVGGSGLCVVTGGDGTCKHPSGTVLPQDATLTGQGYYSRYVERQVTYGSP